MSDSPSVPADNNTDEIEALRQRNAELEQQVASNKKTRGWRMIGDPDQYAYR